MMTEKIQFISEKSWNDIALGNFSFCILFPCPTLIVLCFESDDQWFGSGLGWLWFMKCPKLAEGWLFHWGREGLTPSFAFCLTAAVGKWARSLNDQPNQKVFFVTKKSIVFCWSRKNLFCFLPQLVIDSLKLLIKLEFGDMKAHRYFKYLVFLFDGRSW